MDTPLLGVIDNTSSFEYWITMKREFFSSVRQAQCAAVKCSAKGCGLGVGVIRGLGPGAEAANLSYNEGYAVAALRVMVFEAIPRINDFMEFKNRPARRCLQNIKNLDSCPTTNSNRAAQRPPSSRNEHLENVAKDKPQNSQPRRDLRLRRAT